MTKTPLILLGGDFALALLAYAIGSFLWGVPTFERLLRQDIWHSMALVTAVLVTGFLVDLFAPEKNREKKETLLSRATTGPPPMQNNGLRREE